MRTTMCNSERMNAMRKEKRREENKNENPLKGPI